MVVRTTHETHINTVPNAMTVQSRSFMLIMAYAIAAVSRKQPINTWTKTWIGQQGTDRGSSEALVPSVKLLLGGGSTWFQIVPPASST